MSKSTIKLAAVGFLLLAFASLGLANIRTSNHKIQLQKVELQDSTAKLKLLETKYQTLNKELDKANQSAERVKQLEVEKAQLEEQKRKLELDLQSKRNAQNTVAQAAARIKNNVVPTASASGDAKMFIYMKESGNNPGAINKSSGACGLGQALPCSKLPCSLSDYACQDNWFSTVYLKRYNYDWNVAKAFWLANHWW